MNKSNVELVTIPLATKVAVFRDESYVEGLIPSIPSN